MIDFTPPFRRISLLDGLKEKGIDIPQPLESEAANQYLRAKVKVKGRENSCIDLAFISRFVSGVRIGLCRASNNSQID